MLEAGFLNPQGAQRPYCLLSVKGGDDDFIVKDAGAPGPYDWSQSASAKFYTSETLVFQTGPHGVIINIPGDYRVAFSAHAEGNNASVAAVLDGVPIYTFDNASGTKDVFNTTQVLLSVGAGEELTVVSVDSQQNRLSDPTLEIIKVA